MKVNSARAVRLPMQIKLYENGKLINSTTRHSKAAAGRYLQENSFTSGTIRVMYSRKNDYWNMFPFSTAAEAMATLAQDLEWDLIKEFIDEEK